MKFDDFPEKSEISRNWLTPLLHLGSFITFRPSTFVPVYPNLSIAGNRLHCLRVVDRTINIHTGANISFQ